MYLLRKPKQWNFALAEAEFANNNSAAQFTSQLGVVNRKVLKHAQDLACVQKISNSNILANRTAAQMQSIQEEEEKIKNF